MPALTRSTSDGSADNENHNWNPGSWFHICGKSIGVGELWNESGRAVGWEWNARLTRSTADGSADFWEGTVLISD